MNRQHRHVHAGPAKLIQFAGGQKNLSTNVIRHAPTSLQGFILASSYTGNGLAR
jgi:hypothetical protein